MTDAPRQMDPGRLTLLMDALLTEATPEMRNEFRRRYVPEMPGHADQLQAAADETSELAVAVTQLLDAGKRSGVMPVDVPAWVRLGMLDTLSQWGSGTGTTCLHAPHPSRPQPITAVAWKPGLVSCPPCGGHLFKLPRHSAADRTCDGCGRVTRGMEHGDGIHPITVQLGALLYTVGACSDCTWATGAAPAR